MKFKMIQLGFIDEMVKKIAVNFHKDFFFYSKNFKLENLLFVTHLVIYKTPLLNETAGLWALLSAYDPVNRPCFHPPFLLLELVWGEQGSVFSFTLICSSALNLPYKRP